VRISQMGCQTGLSRTLQLQTPSGQSQPAAATGSLPSQRPTALLRYAEGAPARSRTVANNVLTSGSSRSGHRNSSPLVDFIAFALMAEGKPIFRDIHYKLVSLIADDLATPNAKSLQLNHLAPDELSLLRPGHGQSLGLEQMFVSRANPMGSSATMRSMRARTPLGSAKPRFCR
jgi:hypothetical protein